MYILNNTRYYYLEYEKQISAIREEYNKDNSSEEILLLMIKTLINCFKIEMLLDIQNKKVKPKRNLYTEDYISLAVQYIKEHYTERIDVQDIADAVGLYPNYLQKLFRKKHDTSIMKYLQHYRVEKSCQYLIQTNLSVDEIVTLVGINDVKNYYVYFKRYFNTTPRKYRIEHSEIINSKL